ncbi:hypothetical protein JCM8547_002040 [Rhodosporidiobolus lusitaniae]
MSSNLDKHLVRPSSSPSPQRAWKRGHLASFGCLVFFSLIAWAIAATLVDDYNDNGYPTGAVKDRVRFLLFTGLWTFVFSIVYIIGASFSFPFSDISGA